MSKSNMRTATERSFVVHMKKRSFDTKKHENKPPQLTRLLIQKVPNHMWHIEHDRLQCQHKGYPLVVGDLLVLPFRDLSGDRLVPFEEVGILDETVVVYVLVPEAGELLWGPAGDGGSWKKQRAGE